MHTTTRERRPAAAVRRPSAAPGRPAPALPVAIGLVRATAALTRFVVAVGVSADRRDPIHFEPKVLRTL